MPSYTKSQAQSGRGTVLSIGSTGATPTFSVIGEVKTATQSGSQWGTEDVTNFESGNDQEFQTTIRDNGEFSLAGNRVNNDAGQLATESAFADGSIRPFKLQLPLNPLTGQMTTGDLYTFNALVVSRDFSVEFNKVITFSTKLKVSGAVTLTPGA
jgi:predicted secreted protein